MAIHFLTNDKIGRGTGKCKPLYIDRKKYEKHYNLHFIMVPSFSFINDIIYAIYT